MKLAFIGMGNMAYAILKGGCDRGFFDPAQVAAYDINTARLRAVAEETGITPLTGPAEAAEWADEIRARFGERFDGYIAPLSLSIACHTGPGGFGVGCVRRLA